MYNNCIDLPPLTGEWSPKLIDNPDFQGMWVHPEVPNPEYEADDNLYLYEDFGSIGIDIWQVRIIVVPYCPFSKVWAIAISGRGVLFQNQALFS